MMLTRLPVWIAGITFFVSASIAQAKNLIQIENAKPGDSSWKLSNQAKNNEIEGYASSPSINRGESITFFVNTISPKFTLEIFRMGWYGGAGARKLLTVTLPGVRQQLPTPDPVTGLIECNWSPSYVLTVPDDPSDPTNWMSGIYLAKLTGVDNHKERYIPFVVRDDGRSSDFLFQNSVTTYLAYNSWGGLSLYTNPRAFKVSFNRPNNLGAGAADFINYGWENDMLRFLEREGYDVSYATDLDTHLRGELLLKHKAFLVVGHDEYWSWQMRDNVEHARDQGVSLGFFGANTAYWQVRFEPSPITGAPNRTMVCYKSAKLDPTAQGDPANQHLTTTEFRLSPVNRPEDAMIGGMYETGNINGDLVVSDATNWILQGTGLHNGDHLVGLLGYEADKIFGHAPRGVQQIIHSPYLGQGADGCSQLSAVCQLRFSDMTVYEAESSATVVSTGTMHWNWGLDKVPPNPFPPSPAIQQATRNILERFLHPSPVYLQPRSLAFPNQVVTSTSPQQEIVIINHESGPLTVQQVVNATGLNYKSHCPGVLAPGERCTIDVNFPSRAVGKITGSAQFILNNDLQHSIEVPLTAEGVNFTLTSALSSPVSKTVEAGAILTYQLSLASLGYIGNVALKCEGLPSPLKCTVTSAVVALTDHASSPITITIDTTNVVRPIKEETFSYPFRIRATAEGVSHSVNLELNIHAQAKSLQATPSQGKSTSKKGK